MSRSRFPAIAVFALLCSFAPRLCAGEIFHFTEAKHGKGELRFINGLPVVTLSGTPEEIGEQMGSLMRNAGPGVAKYFKDLLKKNNLESKWPFLVKMANLMYMRFPADYRKELEAGAKAADMDLDTVIVGNTFWDISRLMGCSAVIVEPARSTTGSLILGRNFDFPTMGMLDQYSVVVVCKPKGKHAFVSVGFPGLIGCVSGMNDSGLTIATLEVHTTGDGSPKINLTGLPMPLTFRRILEDCTTVAEAEKILRAANRTTYMNLIVCDRNGGVVFEMTPKQVVVRKPVDSLCFCTNHFRTDNLKTTDINCNRFCLLEKCKEMPKISVDDIAKKMHEVSQGELTIQSMIFEPGSLKLHLSLGKGPCSAVPPKEIDLNGYFKGTSELRTQAR